MFDLPVWPTDPERPAIESWATVLAFALYASIMLGAVLWTTVDGVTLPQLGALAAGNALLFSLVVLATVSLRRTERLDRESVAVTAYGNLAFLFVYVGAYELERVGLAAVIAAASTTDRLLGVLVAFEEAVLLTVLLGFLERSVRPDLPPEMDDQVYYLELYMTNLWRIFRLSFAVIVSVGIGIVVTVFPQFGEDFDTLVVNLILAAIPGAVLITQVILQLEYITNMIKRKLGG